MKKLLTLFTALIVIAFVAIATTKSMSAPEECCGKCMGKSNCTACSSCKYCAHCNSGGSCGVCAYTPPPKKETYTPLPPKQETKKQTTVTNNIITTTKEIYTVTAENLNVRNGAGANEPVVGKLMKGDTVEVLEKTNDEWWKVCYTGEDGKMIWGYVSFKYLTK